MATVKKPVTPTNMEHEVLLPFNGVIDRVPTGVAGDARCSESGMACVQIRAGQSARAKDRGSGRFHNR